ncbi:hypothetical protein Tco_0036199 [Tanacetum coccineum]
MNDCENLGKLQPKADIGIFIGYAPTKKAFQIYNRRTRRIIETIHVDFDELTAMVSADNTLGPASQRKEKCTLQCALSSKEEKSSCFRPFSSTMTYSHMLRYYTSGSTYMSRTKKKAKAKQNQAQNGKDKVRGQPSEENTT